MYYVVTDHDALAYLTIGMALASYIVFKDRGVDVELCDDVHVIEDLIEEGSI